MIPSRQRLAVHTDRPVLVLDDLGAPRHLDGPVHVGRGPRGKFDVCQCESSVTAGLDVGIGLRAHDGEGPIRVFDHSRARRKLLTVNKLRAIRCSRYLRGGRQ